MTIRIKSLHIYPLKSARGLTVDHASLVERGFRNDRMWMLVDENNKFITQRQNTKLATITPFLLPDGILGFQAPGQSHLNVSEHDLQPLDTFVRIWDDQCHALAASEETSAWFSSVLGQTARLVRQDERFLRQTDQTFSKAGDHVSFADGFPVLVTSASSLESLTKYFNTDVGMERFRPNIVLEGAEPFAEDQMHILKIGVTAIEMVKHCSRCVITTIDQMTGDKPSNDLLRILSQFRMARQDNKPGSFFGINAIPRALGDIKTGDTVEVLSSKPLGLEINPKRVFLTALAGP